MLGASCLIPGGNGELTPLIRGDKFQMCLNVVRLKAVPALTSVLTTPITALRIGGSLYERGPLWCYVINNAKAPVLPPAVCFYHNPICTSDPHFAFLEAAAFCPL